ncbi:MAG: ABC transporter substrate-binding protein [Dehalococcoidia bacterium]
MAESTYWNRFWRRRVSRRGLLGGSAVAAAGVGAAALVGCNSGGGGGNGGNGGGTPRPDVPEGSPIPGGTITQGRTIAALGIDPHVDLTGLDIVSMMYSYMYSWDAASESIILNNLATDFENPDPLNFIFTLRDDVRVWPAPYGGAAADKVITSEDCVSSFKRRGEALTAPDKRFPKRIERFDAPNPTTFSFVMSRPFVPAIREMANATWAIVPSEFADTNLSQVAYGSGPMMMEEFRGQERIVLTRHPNYFCAPKPWVDTWRLIVITEDSSLLAAFRNGDHDINGAFLDRERAEEFGEDDDFEVFKAPSLFYPVVHIKMKDPWRDIRVREAFSLAINRDELIDTIQDGEGNYSGPIQWPQFNWALPQEELRAFYKFDQDRARELLAEAGVPNPSARLKLPDLSAPSIVGQIAELIQNQVNQVGFQIELDAIELGTFISSVILPGNFDLAFFPNLPYDEPDRPLSFYHSLGVTGTGNWTNYTNPDLDVLIDAQSEEFDPVKRKEIILEAQRMILPEFGPQITTTGGFNYAANWKHVQYGPEGRSAFGGLDTDSPEEGVEFCPFPSEVWTEKD